MGGFFGGSFLPMWSLHSVRQSVADRAQDSPVRNIYHLDFPSRCIQDKNKTYPTYIHLEVKDVKIRVDNSELNTFSGTWKSSKLFFLCFFHISRWTQLTNINIKMNKTSQLSRAINCWKSEVSFIAAEVTPSKLWFALLYSYVLTLRDANLFS